MALTDNLVGYWKLAEASGNRLDSHVNAITLLEAGGTVNSATGKIDQGANIVRADVHWLRCASNPSLQLGDIDFTIACWAKFSSFAALSGTLASKDNGANWETDFYVSSAGKLGLYVERGGVWASPEHTMPLSTGTWYFLVGIHDAANDLIKLSVNNGPVQTAAFSGGTAVLTTGSFNIGNAGGGDLANSCDGIIDELGVWKRVLSPAEITTLYNGGAGLTYPFVTSNAGYRSLSAFWMGGITAMPLPPVRGGYRSPLAFWMGGANAGAFIPPEPAPPLLAHGAGMEQYRQHLREQAIAIDDEEILLILSEAFGVIE